MQVKAGVFLLKSGYTGQVNIIKIYIQSIYGIFVYNYIMCFMKKTQKTDGFI